MRRPFHSSRAQARRAATGRDRGTGERTAKAGPSASPAQRDRRLALIRACSGAMQHRLSEQIRLDLESQNGHTACGRLKSGSVDCCCDYCEAFWTQLEQRLRQINGSGDRDD